MNDQLKQAAEAAAEEHFYFVHGTDEKYEGWECEEFLAGVAWLSKHLESAAGEFDESCVKDSWRERDGNGEEYINESAVRGARWQFARDRILIGFTQMKMHVYVDRCKEFEARLAEREREIERLKTEQNNYCACQFRGTPNAQGRCIRCGGKV